MHDYICSLKSALLILDRNIKKAFGDLTALFEERDRLLSLIEKYEEGEAVCVIDDSPVLYESKSGQSSAVHFERYKWHRSFFDDPLTFEEAVFVDADVDVGGSQAREQAKASVLCETPGNSDPLSDCIPWKLYDEPTFEEFGIDRDLDADYIMEALF